MSLRNREYLELLALVEECRVPGLLVPSGVLPNVFFSFSPSCSDSGVSNALEEFDFSSSFGTFRSRRPSWWAGVVELIVKSEVESAIGIFVESCP
jgi:hypothetical protein